MKIKMDKKKIKLISIISAVAILLTLMTCLYACPASRTDEAELADERDTSTTKSPDETSVYTPPIYQGAQGDDGNNEETTTDEPEVKEPAEKSLEFISNGNGTCTLVSIGSITDTCIIIPEKSPEGEVVTNIGAKAFYGNKKINAVQIPSTVTFIGDMAFGGCSSLIYISVSPDNKSFTDENGILYSADKKTLIHYPALKGNDTLKISSSVTTISAMAFYDCEALKYIEFDGAVSQWAKINIGEMNYSLFSISIKCTNTK